MKFTFALLVLASATEARAPGEVFSYWGKPASAQDSQTVWGEAIDGKDVLGTFYSRNGKGNTDHAGSAEEQQLHSNGLMHTTNSEINDRTAPSNCQDLHSSAGGKGTCLIGAKCGPCPVKTAFPTPAPTPAPTVPIPNKCVRTGKNGVIRTVPFGWAGVGADDKYCLLERCQQCENPKKYPAPYDDQYYCPMVPHTDMSQSSGGVCGKHQFKEVCRFVTCKYSPSIGMKVTVDQGTRTKGMFPEVGTYVNGDQHECRAHHEAGGAWGCTCKCASSPAKWDYTNGFSAKSATISAFAEGSSYHKAMTITSDGCQSINLSDYRLDVYHNGKTSSPNYKIQLPAKTLKSGESFTVCNKRSDTSSYSAAWKSNCDMYTHSLLHNGNDVMQLMEGTRVVESVGTLGSTNYFAKDKTCKRTGPGAYPAAFDCSFSKNSPPNAALMPSPRCGGQ